MAINDEMKDLRSRGKVVTKEQNMPTPALGWHPLSLTYNRACRPGVSGRCAVSMRIVQRGVQDEGRGKSLKAACTCGGRCT